MSPIAKAASVLLVRGSTDAELFVIQRAETLRFLGGFRAFPGGKVATSDGLLPETLIEDSRQSNQILLERSVAAARELFEETGILLARRPDRSFPASSSTLSYLRRKLIAENWPIQRVLKLLSLRLHLADFQYLGRLTTPPFLPTRFDTAFFLAHLPSNQRAEVWPGELAKGEWTTAAGLLQCWTRGDCLIASPTLAILQALRNLPAGELASRLAQLFASQSDAQIPVIHFSPDVLLIPLDTESLPPSTHTNAFLVGRGPVYLIDPGSALAEEQGRLFTLLDAQAEAGRRVTAVVLTHQHPDHIGAASACAERYRVPIFAHPLTAKRLQGKVAVERELRDGDRLDLGPAPDMGGAWFVEALHTPGHAPGHLAFYDPHYQLLFAGDMVSTLSSVVIGPPDGDLAVYLDSLRRLRNLPCRLLLPAHGSPSARPQHTIDACIAHRVRREQQLLAAMRATPRSVPELAIALYKGLPPNMIRFAELQVQAGIEKLEREGRVVATGVEQGRKWSASQFPNPKARRFSRINLT